MYLNLKKVSSRIPASIRCPADDQLRIVGRFGNLEVEAPLKPNTVEEVLLNLICGSSVVQVPRAVVLFLQAKTLVWYLMNDTAE